MTKAKLIGTSLLFTSMLFGGAAAQAAVVPYGMVDDLQEAHSADLGNSGNVEKAWIEGIFGVGTTYTQVSSSGWMDQGGGIFALEVSDPTEYFYIKTGNIGGTDNEHFLYKNLSLSNYLVIDLIELGISPSDNIDKVSHYGLIGVSEVPIPAAAWLFGSGLMGFNFLSRRKRFRA